LTCAVPLGFRAVGIHVIPEWIARRTAHDVTRHVDARRQHRIARIGVVDDGDALVLPQRCIGIGKIGADIGEAIVDLEAVRVAAGAGLQESEALGISRVGDVVEADTGARRCACRRDGRVAAARVVRDDQYLALVVHADVAAAGAGLARHE
jgi:hypothetical protein